jgi:two-component sensor histidine kinase
VKIFKTPKTEFKDAYDIARFQLTWRICLFMSVVTPIQTVIFYFSEQDTFYPTLVATFIAWGFLTILIVTKHYTLVAILFAIIGMTLSQISMSTTPQVYHVGNTLWMLVIVLYAFFSLGRIWGSIVLSVDILGLGYHLYFISGSNFADHQINSTEMLGLLANYLIAGVILLYMITNYLKIIRLTENNLKDVNAELEIKNVKVEAQNREKTVMLKEIHHRVKNNLQVITSLLRLQSSEINDPDSKAKFEETVQRVLSMALIHEKMYQTEDLSQIDLSDYLQTLSQELIRSYNVEKPIDFKVKCEIESIVPKALVSVALIFNELISNSLKHAFSELSEGKISIDIHRISENQVKMIFEDNGSWKTQSNEESFGLELIKSLVEQLEGEYELDTTDNTIYNFIFSTDNLENL